MNMSLLWVLAGGAVLWLLSRQAQERDRLFIGVPMPTEFPITEAELQRIAAGSRSSDEWLIFVGIYNRAIFEAQTQARPHTLGALLLQYADLRVVNPCGEHIVLWPDYLMVWSVHRAAVDVERRPTRFWLRTPTGSVHIDLAKDTADMWPAVLLDGLPPATCSSVPVPESRPDPVVTSA